MAGPVRTLSFSAPPGPWQVHSAPPAPDLRGFVVEYWEVEGHLRPFREKVVPNGCVELMVNLGPVHRTLTEKGSTAWQLAWLSGLQERALHIESPHGTHLVSVRLHPLGARDLLGCGVPESATSIVELDALIGSAACRLRDRLVEAGSPNARFNLLEEFLRRRLSHRASRHVVRWAAWRIESAHGNLPISRLHEELGISRKHLALMFARDLGVTPKAYARVQRFAWVMTRIAETSRVDWARLAAEAGYSDQSHLVRDFQQIASATPTEYLGTRMPGGDSLLTESR